MRHVREVLAASAPLPTLHARAALPGDPSALGCLRAGLRRGRAGASSPLLGSMPCAGALWLGTTAKPRLGAFPLPCRFCSCLLKARGASPGRGEVVRGAETPFFPAPCSSAATPEQQPVSQPRGERARKWPAPGFRGAKKQCVQVDASRCSRLSNQDPSVLGILPHPQLSVLCFSFGAFYFFPQQPGERVCFLPAPLVTKEGDMSLCLTLLLCPQLCPNTVPVVLRAAGRRWLPQSRLLSGWSLSRQVPLADVSMGLAGPDRET